MKTVQQAARRLIKEQGQDAAGEAFARAIEARISNRQNEANRWLEIAVDVMRQDRAGQRVRLLSSVPSN
jgi:hypothetical protein